MLSFPSSETTSFEILPFTGPWRVVSQKVYTVHIIIKTVRVEAGRRHVTSMQRVNWVSPNRKIFATSKFNSRIIFGRQKISRLKISRVSPYIVYTYTLERVQEYSRQKNSRVHRVFISALGYNGKMAVAELDQFS